MKLFTFSNIFFGVALSQSDILPPPDRQSIGGQHNDNNCLIGAGYSWCSSSNSCIRQWETPCEDNYSDCHDCLQRQRNGENIACPSSCDILTIQDPCQFSCPPTPPCPMLAYSPNCDYIPSPSDKCGCAIGCPTTRCNPQVSQEGGSCGGFMAPGYSHTCSDGLECVNTMGPLIADAPGTCQPACPTLRDHWGNCVDENCLEWNDGCNTCSVLNKLLIECTEEVCYVNPGNSICQLTTNIPTIPHNCASWNDGCNTCMVNNGQITSCTLMMCFRMGEPYCQSFYTGDLQENEVCYRFCEDGSQSTLDRQNDCPSGTQCISNPNIVSMIAFDTCGDRTKKCITIKGH
jgi:hypothetical protein